MTAEHTGGSHFSHYHFHGQRPDEEIILVVHRHWFDIVFHYLAITIIAALVIASFFMEEYVVDLFDITYAPALLFFVDSIILTFLWFYGFVIWIDYYLDVWVITNQRVVNVEQKGLFARQVSELHYHTIQDITSHVSGIIPTLLNYGDVEVQTAAAHTRFLFRHVPDPYKIRAILIKLQRKAYEETVEEREHATTS